MLTVLIINVNSQVFTNYTTTNGLVNNNVNSIAIDAQGIKWFGTGGGISKFNGTTWVTYNSLNGISNNVSAIAIDKQNNYWFGTQGGGISRYDGTNWTLFDTKTSSDLGNINAITIDNQGNKWFGNMVGCAEYDGVSWRHDIPFNNSYNIISVAFDSQGNKWFGTFQSGVFKFDIYNSKTQFNKSYKLAGDNVNSITIDSQGNRWFGTESGISMFDGTKWTTYTTTNGLVNNYVLAIAIDNVGNKWFGTAGGVSKFDGTTWTNYTTANGLLNNNVFAIAIDAQNNKWFGTSGGVSMLYDGTVTNITNNQLLSNFSVYPSNVKDLVNIKTTKPFGTLHILDLNGKCLISKNVGSLENSINVSKLLKGLYVIKYVSSSTTQTEKFLKE
jgi:ligand-binding sensor domain-containing protein